MPALPIVPVGHPVLRQVSRPLDRDELASDEMQRLVDDLIDTMRHEQGAGVAANQVGVPVQVAVIEVGENARYPYKPPIPLTVIVNPVIEPIDDEVVEINEGCLSVPLRGVLKRHVNIRVRCLDRHGEEQVLERHGLTAGTFQHETDHLNGTLIVDRIDPATLSTWEQYRLHHEADFVERITEFVDRVGS